MWAVLVAHHGIRVVFTLPDITGFMAVLTEAALAVQTLAISVQIFFMTTTTPGIT